MTLTPGDRLGRFEITAALGAGGMGVVYKARDTQLDRDVAIKVVRSSRTDQAPAGELLDEARAASRLNHPHVCTIHEVFELDGRSHIVMEFAAGRLLKECIPRDGLPTAAVLAYGVQIASAIAHAHDCRIVHGDLKSANIIVTGEGRLKVFDFGLARHVPVDPDEERTRSPTASSAAGTLSYMAPELLRGERPTFGTDIWALGVVLYELAAGRLPFAAAADAELSSAILRDPPTELSRSVPTTLRSVIHRALSKDPASRYQRASELLAALDVLRVDPAISAPAPKHRRPGSRHRRRTVRALAVLPLENLSSDPSQDYFVDGLTEALIAELARIRAVRVTSRTSVMRYKGSTRSAPEIAAELGVDALVEGSVLRFGDRVRVTAQLIDAHDDAHLWADSYDRDLRDILALQHELARAIAGEIRVLTPQESRSAVRRVNPEGYERYLKGRHLWNRRTEDSMRKGLQAFSAAVALDPGYALAYVGQADSFNVLGWYGVMPPSDAFPKAKAAAHQALELDPTLGEAYTSLAYATNYYDWDWEGARAGFEKAIELNPRYALAHHWFAIQRASVGDVDRALKHIALAVELDPLSLSINAAHGFALLLTGSPDRAAERLRAALDLDPAYPLAQAWLAIANIDRNPRESLRLAERVEALSPDSLALVAMAGHCRARAGDREGAVRVLDGLERAATERYVAPAHLAAVYSGLGEVGPALAALERAIQDRSFSLVWPKTHPMFDPLRADSRFQELLRSVGL